MTDSSSLYSRLALRDDTAMPAYRQIEEQISALIFDGTLPAGATLPAARQLAKELSVSRATVQYGYDALRRSSLVTAHGRLGFIVEPDKRLRPGMERLKGFTEEMHELGRVPSSRILEREVVVDRSIASVFDLPSNARLLKLVRLRFGDDVPLSREIAWYNLAAVPSLEDCDLSGSVYEQIAACGARLVSCEQSIEAAEPDPHEMAGFDFIRPIPCLLIKRRSYAGSGQLIEYVEGLFRGDAYAYRLTLKV